MPLYVTLRSTHNKLQETRVFNDEATAMQYAFDVVLTEGFEPIDSEGKPWLGNWGDDDGCGMIVTAAEAE